MQKVTVLSSKAFAMNSWVAIMPAFWGMHVIATLSFSAVSFKKRKTRGTILFTTGRLTLE
jgi:hypothetical protein